MWINFIVFALNFPVNYLFVGYLGWGLDGSAYTFIVANVIGSGSMVAYVLYTGAHKPTWPEYVAVVVDDSDDIVDDVDDDTCI